MHAIGRIGNLRPMNKWRIVGLALAALLVTWLILRGFAFRHEGERATQPPAPSAEAFHISKPLRVQVTRPGTPAARPAPDEWLERELRHLLIRGRLRVAAIDPSLPRPFTLRVELPPAPNTPANALTRTAIKLSLQAPDGKVERSAEIELSPDHGQAPGALGIMQALARQLPAFLGATRIAADSGVDWSAFIGTDDAAAYDSFLSSAEELLGSQGRGFTASSAPPRSLAVERLETLTRKHRDFTRALALLSVGYISLGGKDDASLIELAASNAQRALATDHSLATAQSALGLVELRRGEWAAAQELFKAALTLDANSPIALEGLACLLMDVGQAAAALAVAQRAIALQPANVGARECLAYARFATGKDDGSSSTPSPPAAHESLEIAQVNALHALLSGDTHQAQRILGGSVRARDAAWVDPVLQAASDRSRIALALQAITRAASDGTIDPITELVCGTALREADFVFNRMLRLHRQNQPVPLRLLWLPQAEFLRRHARFAEIIDAEALPGFWQDHGRPDYCAREPTMYGCKPRGGATVAGVPGNQR